MLSLWKSGKIFVLSAVMFSAGVGVATVALSYLPSAIATPGMVAGGVKQSKAEQVVEENGFKWELQNCRRAGQKVICNFLVTDTGQRDKELSLIGRSSRMFDLSGNEYRVTANNIGEDKTYTNLIRGIPTKASFTFLLPPEVTKIAVFEIIYNSSLDELKLQFRDINVSGSQASNPTNPVNNCTCPPQTNPKKPRPR